MYHIPDTLYDEKLPKRAKQLFVDTFSKHHKLNAGDEDAAMQKAREALENRYVRVNNLQWIPRQAAYEIIRDEVSDNSDNSQTVAQPNKRFVDKRRRTDSSSSSSDSSGSSSSAYETDEETKRTNAKRNKKRTNNNVQKNNLYKKSKPQYNSFEDKLQHTSEDDNY
ncbi:hypothetical protein [Epiphyas postvittana nucleopolyhedrovirus]|uniref:Uncharacterized protein n=1 Tax=Epiphyas postvittana nucleopolyhedrovirus TaxID=70600 RepID=Q91GJ8_NPVEP|nr:hypothetical protein [Epiphyas postvittana nucleopolyhedrovirus]AAK85617.1 unknown [Epiphyas postvittana nucleopolyhedrovirus]